MRTERIIVIGAGGHAKVVMDALLCAFGGETDAAFADDNPALGGALLLGRLVQAPVPSHFAGICIHVAIGDNRVRQRLSGELGATAKSVVSIIHPAASVSRFAMLGEGIFVAAHAVVAPDAHIGAGTIVNHGAIIDHDCAVGAFSHVAPSAALGGGVRVGSRVLVGAGAVIKPGVFIEDDVVIGAGAVVIANVASGTLVMGVPARSKVEGRS